MSNREYNAAQMLAHQFTCINKIDALKYLCPLNYSIREALNAFKIYNNE